MIIIYCVSQIYAYVATIKCPCMAEHNAAKIQGLIGRLGSTLHTPPNGS